MKGGIFIFVESCVFIYLFVCVCVCSEQSLFKKDVADGSWVSSVFEEPNGTAAKMWIKRRTYCFEMNSL